MRKAKILGAIAACTLFIMQSCNKNEPFKKDQSPGSARAKTVMVDEVTGTLGTGTYQLVPKLTVVAGNPKSVGVIGASTATNAGLEQRTYTSSTVTNTGKQWTITSLGSGEYKIINTNSGMAMTILFGSPADVYVIQVPYTGTNSQKWVITYEGSNNYRIKCKADQTWGMHIDGGSIADGGRVRLKQYATQPANNGYFQLYWAAYRDLTVTNWFKRNTTGWNAADGAWSIALSSGKSIWNFGDTHIDQYNGPGPGLVNCLFNNRSSALLQTNGDWAVANAVTLKDITYAYKSYWKSNPASGYFNWPGSGFQFGDTAYVYLRTYQQVGGTRVPHTDQWGKLKVTGLGTATARQYHQLQNFGTYLFGFGTIEKDGYMYMYAKKKNGAVSDMYVARFPKTISGIHSPWQFWKGGSTWATDTIGIVPIITSVGFFSFVNKIADNKYVLVSTDINLGCNGTTDLVVRTNSGLTNGWSAAKVIYNIDDRLNGDSPFWYSAYAHNQYINNNEVLFTYSINNYHPCEPACSGGFNPDYYRPQAVRVPMKLLNTGW